MSIIININDRKQKLISKKLMLHDFVIYPAIHGNSKLQFPGAGVDFNINIQLDNFKRSNSEVNMSVGGKVGQVIQFLPKLSDFRSRIRNCKHFTFPPLCGTNHLFGEMQQFLNRPPKADK